MGVYVVTYRSKDINTTQGSFAELVDSLVRVVLLSLLGDSDSKLITIFARINGVYNLLKVKVLTMFDTIRQLIEGTDTIFFIISICTISIFLLRLIKITQKMQREKYRIKKENEELNYLLRTEIPKDAVERYYNNSIYFKNSNFDYEKYEERLLYEIKRLRGEIASIKETKITLDERRSDKNNSFNYQEFIYQLSGMTNIKYLFEMMNEEKEIEINCIKNVLSDVVHTVRNPVSGIKAIISVMKMDENISIEMKRQIEDIESCLKQIENNLNTYYQISNITSLESSNDEKIEFSTELLNTIKLLVVSSGKNIAVEDNIEKFEISKEISKVLILAITCILDNAFTYSPDNGIIAIDVKKEQKQISIDIQNQGPIVEPTVLNQIFDQGFSTRQSTGRGLAIAKKAIEEMLNGIIVCENTGEEKGVKFSILIEVEETNE